MCVCIIIALCGDVEKNPGPPKQNEDSQKQDQGREYNRGLHSRFSQYKYQPRADRKIDTSDSDIDNEMDTDNLRTEQSQQGFHQTLASPIFTFTAPSDPGAGADPNLSNVDVNTMLFTITTQISALRDDVNNWRRDLNKKCDEMRFEFESELDSMHARVTRLEDEAKQNNLIFFGIDDMINESAIACEDKVRKVMRDDLELDEGAIEIAEVYRNGRTVKDKPRPVTVVMSSKEDKRQVLFTARTKFPANSKYRIKQDYCESTRLARRKLSEYYDDAVRRSSRDKVKVVGDTMYVGNQGYRYDFRSEKLKKIKRPP